MSLQTRDLRCIACGAVMPEVPCEYLKYPPCSLCSGAMVITWERGKPPSTDVYGSAKWNEASGQVHSSTREVEQFMADPEKGGGFYPAGDLVGGARADHTMKHTTISAPKLGLRTSTGERR